MDIKNLGINLVRLRNEYGLSQEKMAKILNISYKTYWLIEKGTKEPKLSIIIDICNRFDISADYLLSDPMFNVNNKPYKTEKERIDKLTSLQLELLPKEVSIVMYELAIVIGKRISTNNYI